MRINGEKLVHGRGLYRSIYIFNCHSSTPYSIIVLTRLWSLRANLIVKIEIIPWHRTYDV